jgi:acyl-CoA thioesterase
VVERLCAPFGFLYGGTGLAACVAAAEAVTGRPLVWITTQYVANAVPGEQVGLTVEVVAEGRATSQTHVRGAVGERTVLHATTAHTDRPTGDVAAWGGPPDVSAPDDCPPVDMTWAPTGRSFIDDLDRRFPPENEQLVDAGRIAMWCRIPSWPIGTPASQGYVADIVPMAVSLALGRPPGGTSLDNTVRIVVDAPPAAADDGWVLLDIEAEGFGRSIGHGRVRLWRPDGALLGIGTQSCIVRTSHHGR